ncbi:hypothetical protein [Microbacterium sp. NPDC089695]|uniref:hypothetical protein n=1 Tax=Microbacterium sp. NPDC089695 TaxID=3364198 RepID=UPI0038027881
MPALIAALTALTILTPLSACTSASHDDGPAGAATSFINEYDQWAQDGYTEPIPEGLKDASSGTTIKELENDRLWYSQGGIQQEGSLQIVDTSVVSQEGNSAVVRVTIDSSDIAIFAEGKKTFMSEERTTITELTLKRTDRWRVTRSEQVEQK